MPTTLDTSIAQIVARAAAEISSAVRANIAAEINRVVGAHAAAAPAAPAKRRGRPPGSGKKAKAAGAAAPAAAPAAKPSKGKASRGRRTSTQVAADDAKILAFVKGHGGLRSEEIEKQVGLPKPSIASGLLRLRESSKIKMKGVKRAATYTAA